ncbi:MAG: indole-3-glycerol phosphate synthase TrpC, partial [Polaribacter sp.]
MTILDKIIAFKKKEVAKIKAEVPVKKLIESPNFGKKVFSLKKSLLETGSTGIIAEFKRQSPSKGIINEKATIVEVTKGYLDANVAAQSILTDTSFFGGTMADLMEARVINLQKPILRKDFIVDGFQIVEAKAIGADVILLIASCLTSKELKNYGNLATDLGMEVLYEI